MTQDLRLLLSVAGDQYLKFGLLPLPSYMIQHVDDVMY